MADKRDKLTSEQIAEICQAHFSQPVTRITAPGGKDRDSMRVHFPDRNIIATQRAYPGRMRLEVEVLGRLGRVGAPVPRLLGKTDRVFFQEDIGSARLSGRLDHAKGGDLVDLVARAFGSIVAVQDAGEKSGLSRIVPPLGEAASWVSGLVSTPAATSRAYGVAPPSLEYQPLIDRLLVSARRFVKWDARPGNGAVGIDDRVYWFDWEHCGRRQGMEDFAWLAGDEFFPLDAAAVLPILQDVLPAENRADNLDYLAHFIVFHMVQRLTIIHRQYVSDGWDDPHEAMRYDNIGVDPDLAVALCQRGASWAARAALTAPLVPWFRAIATTIDAMRPPRR